MNALPGGGDAVAEPLSHVNRVYTERDQLVCALSKLFPAHLVEDVNGDPGWRTVVCIHLPTGQATWHIPNREWTLFEHLKHLEGGSDWDGHTTEEKYERLAALRPTWSYFEDRRAEEPA